jgi:hypothetical protein
MKIRILFYRPAIDKHLLDNAISFWSMMWNPSVWNKKFKTSHVEIWLPDSEWGHERFCGNDQRARYEGICYTATMGQSGGKNRKYNGVCQRTADEVLIHPHRWFYAELELPDTAVAHAESWAMLEVANNKGYDIGDIMKYFFPVRHQSMSDHKFICSGFSWAFLFKCAMWYCVVDKAKFMDDKLWKLIQHREITDLPSPVRLAMWMYQAGYKFYSLETGKEIQ